MNANRAAHPSLDDLRAFNLGQAAAAAAETVAAHLATCSDCRAVLASLPSDNFAGRLKKAQPAVAVAPPLGPSGTVLEAPPTAAAIPPELARHAGYEMQRKLGEGGMGVVWLAQNKTMDRLEVLKVVHRDLLNRPGASERFEQEIRSAARLLHANVVTAYSVLRLGELLVLVMEYVDGKDLERLVRDKGPQPVAYACHYARQVALGLQQAFEQGMVHRDIKPQNLIRNRKGEVKILDFGLAKVCREHGPRSGLTSVAVLMGTPNYMAPEQAIDARSADIRADIYSLGCTLYFLLAGRPPFVEATPMETVLAHLHKQPGPIDKERPDVPAELAAVVMRMLAKDPAERHQTPVEVARELAPFIKTGAKPPASPLPPPLPWSSPASRTAGPNDTSPPAPRPQSAATVLVPKSVQEVKPPSRERGAGRRPAPPRHFAGGGRGRLPRPPLWAVALFGVLAVGFCGLLLVLFWAVNQGRTPSNDTDLNGGAGKENNAGRIIGSWQMKWLRNGIPETSEYTFNADGTIQETDFNQFGQKIHEGGGRYSYENGEVTVWWASGSVERARLDFLAANQFRYEIVSHSGDPGQVGLVLIYQKFRN